jgi:hypothetical protein
LLDRVGELFVMIRKKFLTLRSRASSDLLVSLVSASHIRHKQILRLRSFLAPLRITGRGGVIGNSLRLVRPLRMTGLADFREVYGGQRSKGILTGLACLLVTLSLIGCGPKPGAPTAPGTADLTKTSAVSASANPVTFTEIASQAGIAFQHNNGAAGKKNMPETVGSGVAFVDYDNDGFQDILLVDSMNWPGDKPRHDTLHLYHNKGNGTFEDVTHAAGLDIEIYGMGVSVGDFDNDGFEDLFITSIGPNHLFRNMLGDPKRGTGPLFQDVTTQAGVAGVPMPGMEMKWKWSASSAWLDYDKDGKLDLFVTQYVKWSPDHNMWCGHNGVRGYCPPKM